MWTYYVFRVPTHLLGTMKKNKRENHYLWHEVIVPFILPPVFWSSRILYFLKHLSCFLIFDGEFNPNRNSNFNAPFLHGLDFLFECLFSLCHFLLSFFFSHWISPHHFFFILNPWCQTFFCTIPGKCVLSGG